MALNDSLKSAAIEELKRVNINMIGTYARTNGKVLGFLYDNNIIDDSSIEASLESAVFSQARQDYKTMTAKGRDHILYADHIGRPECLAYALNKGKFSRREIRKIPFDHKETAETFSKHYGRDNLLSILREELLNPKPLPASEPYSACCSH